MTNINLEPVDFIDSDGSEEIGEVDPYASTDDFSDEGLVTGLENEESGDEIDFPYTSQGVNLQAYEDSSMSESDDYAEETQSDYLQYAASRLKLADLLMEHKYSEMRWELACKKIKWDEITVGNSTTDELKTMAKDIKRAVGKVRTLGEILEVFETNKGMPTKEPKFHADFPKAPLTPMFQFVTDNATELKKAQATRKLRFKNWNFARETKLQWRQLGKRKRQEYINAFEKKMVEYKLKKKAFYEQHPELKPNYKTKQGAAVKSPNTPFRYFWRKICKETGTAAKFRETLCRWKNLPEEEKAKVILEALANKEVDEKFIGKNEAKIVQKFHGKPKLPMTLYRFYGNKFKESEYGMKKVAEKGLHVAASENWKKLTKKNIESWLDDYMKFYHSWSLDLELWIRKRPKDEQAALFNQHRNHIGEEAMEKKRKSLVKDMAKLPDNTFKSCAYNGSIKIKREILEEPTYCSQTTAHYFMFKVYNGDTNNIALAYGNLSSKTKKKYRDEMIKARRKSLSEVKSFLKKLEPAAVASYNKKLKEKRASQKMSLHWHHSTGTDDESGENQGSSDSDSN